jgi:large subunit ribosomal protein L32e
MSVNREKVIKELNAKRSLQKRMREIRTNRPRFLRYLSWKFWKFERHEYWRKPKGNDNKMRLQLKGYPPIVKVGYGSPRDIRNLHPSGLEPVVVHSLNELKGLDPKKHIVYIASNVGLKKRIELIKAAQEKGFKIANAGAA